MSLSIEQKQQISTEQNFQAPTTDLNTRYGEVTDEMRVAVNLGVRLMCNLPQAEVSPSPSILPKSEVLIIDNSYGAPDAPFDEVNLDTLRQAVESISIACPIPENYRDMGDTIIPIDTPVDISQQTEQQSRRSDRKAREAKKKEARMIESQLALREKTERRIDNVSRFFGWHKKQWFEDGINRSKLDKSRRLQSA